MKLSLLVLGAAEAETAVWAAPRAAAEEHCAQIEAVRAANAATQRGWLTAHEEKVAQLEAVAEGLRAQLTGAQDEARAAASAAEAERGAAAARHGAELEEKQAEFFRVVNPPRPFY